MRKLLLTLACGVCLCLAAIPDSAAETVKDREGAIRSDRQKLESGTRWKYNNLEEGLREARESGKPLLVTLRCIPCLACAGIDTEVLLEGDSLASLLDQFVCVRLINANSLDLSLFQFDFDLSWSAIFLNGDGTLYGRFGSWEHQRNPQDHSTQSFEKAILKALEIHQAYPTNKSSLAGKKSQALPWRKPAEMPQLSGKYTPQLSWDTRLVQSCIHCHQIGDALRMNFWESTGTIPTKWIFPYPEPSSIGLSLRADSIAVVDAVDSGSPAALAGISPGDELIGINNQPLISAADLSWILHQTDGASRLDVTLQRAGSTHHLEMQLDDPWKSRSDISRRVGTWQMRALALGGMQLRELDTKEKEQWKIPDDAMALYAQHVGQYGEHAVAKNAGFLKGDIIIRMADIQSRISESALIGSILQRFKPGQEIHATILRDGKSRELHYKAQ